MAFAAHRRPTLASLSRRSLDARKLAELVRWWHTEFSVHQE
jgi:hypothetical protein